MTRIAELFKGLMFLQGHFTRPEDLDGGAAAQARAPQQPASPQPAPAQAPAPEPAPRLGLLQNVWLLGGRPMHAGHNTDLEEPFDVLPAANDAAAPVCAACG